MNYVDLILLLPLAYGLIRGFIKGLVNELASLLSIVAGLYLAYNYHHDVELWLAELIGEDNNWLSIASYLLIFIAVSLVVFLLARVLTRMINFMALGILNRLAGAAFGAAKILLVFLLLIYFLKPFLASQLEDESAWKESQVYRLLSDYSDEAGEWITGMRDDQDADPAQATPASP